MSVGDIIGTVALVFAAIAAWNGYKQLRDARKIAQGQFLLATDQLLAPFETVRRQINKREPPSDPIELRRYMAALERIAYVFEKGYLEQEAIEHRYGSRLRKLINSEQPDYVRMIIKRSENVEGWRDFLGLWTRLREPLGLRNPSSFVELRDVE
jgi:hypothetical protein